MAGLARSAASYQRQLSVGTETETDMSSSTKQEVSDSNSTGVIPALIDLADDCCTVPGRSSAAMVLVMFETLQYELPLCFATQCVLEKSPL
jgi:hypothetical protein